MSSYSSRPDSHVSETATQFASKCLWVLRTAFRKCSKQGGEFLGTLITTLIRMARSALDRRGEFSSFSDARCPLSPWRSVASSPSFMRPHGVRREKMSTRSPNCPTGGPGFWMTIHPCWASSAPQRFSRHWKPWRGVDVRRTSFGAHVAAGCVWDGADTGSHSIDLGRGCQGLPFGISAINSGLSTRPKCRRGRRSESFAQMRALVLTGPSRDSTQVGLARRVGVGHWMVSFGSFRWRKSL